MQQALSKALLCMRSCRSRSEDEDALKEIGVVLYAEKGYLVAKEMLTVSEAGHEECG